MILTREETFRVVCNIRTPIPNGETIGTGIFIGKDNKAVLLTAAHVAKNTNENSYILYCDSNNNTMKRELVILNKNLSWVYHPKADICYLEIDIIRNLDLLKDRCYPYDHIELSGKTPTRDDEMTSVGFPHGLGAKGLKFSPFTFRSYLSSGLITLDRADTQTPCEFFCMENPSVGGYSGGPIFDLGYQIVGAMTTTKDKTRLYGLMHGTISDESGGKIAAVTPIYFLKDIL